MFGAIFPDIARCHSHISGHFEVYPPFAYGQGDGRFAHPVHRFEVAFRSVLRQFYKKRPVLHSGVFRVAGRRDLAHRLGHVVAKRGARDTNPSLSCQSIRFTLYTTPSMA